MPPLQPESTGTSEATTAGQLNQVMGKLIDAGSSGSAAVLTALASIATAITASLIGGSQTFCWSWYFPTTTAKDYKMIVNSPIACTINSVTTICESGTATLTGKINTTALGGTANSVSTSEQTQAHTTSNSLAVGDDFQLTASSVSSLVGMTVTVKITVILAP